MITISVGKKKLSEEKMQALYSNLQLDLSRGLIVGFVV